MIGYLIPGFNSFLKEYNRVIQLRKAVQEMLVELSIVWCDVAGDSWSETLRRFQRNVFTFQKEPEDWLMPSSTSV